MVVKKKGEKPGALLYWETFEMLERAKCEKVKILLSAIRNFAQYGEVPDFEDDEALNLVWPQLEQKLIADDERFERIREERAKAGRKGGLARASKAKQNQANEANATFDKQIKPTTATTTTTSTTTATEIKADKPPHFIPPTVEEVREYCISRNNRVDPERFVDYYASIGWMVGRNKMEDWKAKVRSWERNEQNKDKEGLNGGHQTNDTEHERYFSREIVL